MASGIFIPIFRRCGVNIPENINILYKTYSVKQEKNLHDGQDDLYGQIHYLPEQIFLNIDASNSQKEATLIHEVIHGLDEMYRIGLNEEQVEKLGNAFYMLIRDNPKMFEQRGDVN